MKIVSKILLLHLICMPVHAAVVRLNEKMLTEMASSETPQLEQIEAAFYSIAVRENEQKEKFAPELFGLGQYSETNERALIRFQPVWSPIAQAQLGVRQNLSNGFSTSASITTDQRSAAPTAFTGRFRDVTTTSVRFQVQMDLWKDLFGRLTKADLESLRYERERAEIEKEIQTKAFNISIRRLFWSLVANNESLKISNELLKTAQRQTEETTRRFKSSVAEADELARYEAQVAQRTGTVTFLQYQRDAIVKQLKNLLPKLSGDDLIIEDYDVQKTIDEVIACTTTIASRTEVPYDFTKYDEVISLLKKQRGQRQIVNSRYSDADVKLIGAVKSTGIDSEPSGTGYRGNYGGSVDDQTSNNRTGYEVGLQFVMPLGSAKDNTKKTKELYDEKRLLASIDSSEAQVKNTHFQLVKSIQHLNEVVRAQKVSSAQLGKRLVYMRKKYQQARVSVNDLIQDQDSLFNSELTTIDTQLAIINTIFDYLVIFPETPCSFNRTTL